MADVEPFAVPVDANLRWELRDGIPAELHFRDRVGALPPRLRFVALRPVARVGAQRHGRVEVERLPRHRLQAQRAQVERAALARAAQPRAHRGCAHLHRAAAAAARCRRSALWQQQQASHAACAVPAGTDLKWRAHARARPVARMRAGALAGRRQQRSRQGMGRRGTRWEGNGEERGRGGRARPHAARRAVRRALRVRGAGVHDDGSSQACVTLKCLLLMALSQAPIAAAWARRGWRSRSAAVQKRAYWRECAPLWSLMYVTYGFCGLNVVGLQPPQALGRAWP